MKDLDRIFRWMRRTKPPYRDVFVRWAPLPDDRDGEANWMVFLHPHLEDGDKAVDTLIHEFLHLIEPEQSENWVRRRTKEIVRSLTPRQRKRIERFLATVR